MGLLDPEIMRVLLRYRLPVSPRRVLPLPGEHRTHQPGDGIEFVEYRDYHPGDSTRFIDWKVLARTDRMYVRRHGHESAVRVHLFLDRSASMGYASGAASKLSFGAALLLHLAFVLLHQRDQVHVSVFHDDRVEDLPRASGVADLRRLERALEDCHGTGETRLGPVLDVIRRDEPELIFLASDFFTDATDLEHLLRYCATRRHDLRLVHVLDRDEAEFPFTAYTRFEDPEDPSFRLQVHPGAIRDRYLDALQRFLKRTEETAVHWGVRYSRCLSDQPLREAVLRYLEGA